MQLLAEPLVGVVVGDEFSVVAQFLQEGEGDGVVAELDAATDPPTNDTPTTDTLVWREDVGRLLHAETGPTFVLVGANGVIVARGTAGARYANR